MINTRHGEVDTGHVTRKKYDHIPKVTYQGKRTHQGKQKRGRPKKRKEYRRKRTKTTASKLGVRLQSMLQTGRDRRRLLRPVHQ